MQGNKSHTWLNLLKSRVCLCEVLAALNHELKASPPAQVTCLGLPPTPARGQRMSVPVDSMNCRWVVPRPLTEEPTTSGDQGRG